MLAACLVAGPGWAQGCGAGFRVALDVGHTLSQPGATSARGVGEFEYNRRLALAVEGALGRAGVASVVIGRDGAPLALLERTRLARAADAGLFLSLHHDSVQPQYLSTWVVGGVARAYSDRFRGYSVFVSETGARAAESLRFARGLGAALRGAGFVPSLHHAEAIAGEGRPVLDAGLGVFGFDGLAVLRTAAMPAALLEAGVIVHRGEEAEVAGAGYSERVAGAVVRAVTGFCAGQSRGGLSR